MITILDVNIFNFQESEAFWAISGALAGALATGCINYILQRQQFKHNVHMYSIQNLTRTKAKEYLVELLNHRSHPERKFSTLKKRMANAFEDDELKQLLIEIGARSSSRTDGTELWYLNERNSERNKPSTPGFQ